jgi:hypothetical protein
VAKSGRRKPKAWRLLARAPNAARNIFAYKFERNEPHVIWINLLHVRPTTLTKCRSISLLHISIAWTMMELVPSLWLTMLLCFDATCTRLLESFATTTDEIAQRRYKLCHR